MVVIWQQRFLHLGAADFPLKIPFRKHFKLVYLPLWRRDPVLELQFLLPCRSKFHCVKAGCV